MTSIGTEEKSSIVNWKLYSILLILVGLGVVAGILVNLPMAEKMAEAEPSMSTLTGPVGLAIAILVGLLQGGICSFLGLYFSPKIGFGAPLLEGLMKKEKVYPKLFGTIFIPFILGLAGGLILLGLDFAMPRESLLSMPSALLICENPFYSLLGSISAGINEELISRFFVMSFLIWLIIRLLKKKEPSHFIIWISIALSAFIFASAHLVTIPLLYGAFESWICLKLIILNL